MGYSQLRGILYDVHYGVGIPQVKGNCKEDGDKGSHTKALWTAFFCTEDETQENLPAGTDRKPGLLDVDVHLYMGGGDRRKLFDFR